MWAESVLEVLPINDTARLFEAHAEAISACLIETARSGRWLNGSKTRVFAERFAAYLGLRHCLPVANGTDALELAMRAILQIKRPQGREVVTVANAGGYTVSACRQLGLIPVFADIEYETQNIGADGLLSALGPDTAMVVVTHLYGNIVDVPSLRASMKQAGYEHVPIVEDCAQAHGGSWQAQMAGSMGNIATFSFYPTKNLGALGDGGAVVTSDPDLHRALLALHQYGWSTKYTIEVPFGRNSRLDEIQAAVLLEFLPHLDVLNRKRLAILESYRVEVGNGLHFPASKYSVAHLAIALCEARDDFRRHMFDRSISTDIHYPILDCDQAAWKDFPSRIGPLGLTASRRSVARIVTLPCFPLMKDDEIERVLNALRAWRKQ